MPKEKAHVIQFFIAICGTFAAVFGLKIFNQYLLMDFTRPFRLVLMILTHWPLFFVPGILMKVNKETLRDIGFKRENLLNQIGTGVLLAFLMSLVLTVLPIVLGYKDMVGTTSYTEIWKFAYQFVYSILGVALAEEFIFRGYLFYKLLAIKNSKWFAILISSALFGLFHVFDGNIIQVFVTMIIGFILCVFREKIKGCTLISLVVAHGMYDAMIVLWVSVM